MKEILKKISNTDAPAGGEMYLISLLFPELISEYAPENMPYIDSIGNITLFRRGHSSEKTAVFLTHTDEVGFIVRDITDKGYLKFEEVGEIDARVVISKKVRIGKAKLPGVIGMKAIHLQKKEERETVVPIKNLFIDIGAKSKKNAMKRVNIGDYVTFDTDFAEMCPNIIKGKALERMGVYCLADAISETPQYDTYYIFTAQKHIGARGALIALERIRPDFVYVIDTVETADIYGAKPYESNAALGGGAVIGMMDKRGICDRDLYNRVKSLAEQNNIKYSIMQTVPRSSEIGAIRSSYSGAKAVSICIPCRYTNTPVSLMNINDIKAVSELVKAAAGVSIGGN